MNHITSRKNQFLLHIRKLFSSSAYGQEQGLFVGDGLKLLDTGFQAQFPFTHLIYSDNMHPPKEAQGIPTTFVPEDLMAWLSPMKTPQGGLFIGEIPRPSLDKLEGNYLLLDGLQDPGNVGTIWRTAQGLGASGLILLEHCANPWGHKTVRSSMGACFHLPVYQMTGQEALALFQSQEKPLYATALQAQSKSIHQVSLKDCGVVIGSEGKGVSPLLLEGCGDSLYLPMSPGCQSLNAAMAAGIVLWEMGRCGG